MYDGLGQLQQALNASNAATRFGYDANGNPTQLTDALGHLTTRGYDALDRLTSTMQDAGDASHLNVPTSFSYDALDRLTQVTDPQGLNTQYQYDGLGNLGKLTSPDTGVASYTYDAAGNRLTKTDARPSGNIETDTYDALNRLTTVSFSGYSVPIRTYQYDTTPSICGVGETFNLGHLTQATALATGTALSVVTSLCYDRFGQMVHTSRRVNGDKTQDTRYAYDLAGRLIQTIIPTGTTIDYTRDAAGRIVQVAYQLPGQATFTTVVSNVTYYPFGPVQTITYGNGRTLTRSYDQDYVIGAVSDPGAGGLDYQFSRDPVGNLTGLTSAAGNNLFGYDALNRLTGVNAASTNALIAAYTYDGTGNRLSKQTPAGTQLYTYPLDSHHLLDDGSAARSYDAIGNTTGLDGKTLVYDPNGRNIQLKSGSSALQNYVYDGFGQRIAKFPNRIIAGIHFAYDPAGRIISDYTAGRIAITRQHDYLWMDDLPIGVLSGTAGTLSYIEPDQIGTPRAIIDPARDVAIWSWPLAGDAFGESAPNPDPDGDGTAFVFNLRMPGQYFDAESGLDYNYFRDYDPGTGRYVESDPVGLDGGISTYAYASSDPVNYLDSSGLLFAPIQSPVPSPAPLSPGALTGGGAAGAGEAGAAGEGAEVVGVTTGLGVGGFCAVAIGVLIPSSTSACDTRTKSPQCPDFDRCQFITEQVRARKNDVIERYFAMLKDNNSLYENPIQRKGRSGSWVGHIQQFREAQVRLKKAIDVADSLNCPVDPDARKWASMPPPNKPLPRP